MNDELAPVVDRATAAALTTLADRLRSVATLHDAERRAVHEGTAAVLRQEVWRKVSRTLLLELHAARMTGQLTAATSQERWQEWVASVNRPDYWDSLRDRYPTLPDRLRTLTGNRCAAAAALAERFAADRGRLASLGIADPELAEVSFGAGDSHRGGQTVAALRFTSGQRVIYKPRSLRVDRELGALLPRLLPEEPDETRIRVAPVLCRDGYGWAGYVDHRYCADDAELATFYRGIGHWLALTQLLSASDLHAENLIAAGPVPVVVDCETLFTPYHPAPDARYGDALARASNMINGSVMRIGLLPVRMRALGLRGIDISATGSLPGVQPMMQVPTVVDAGTDQARVGFTQVPAPEAANHPSAEPVLERHWPAVLAGFDELTGELLALDQAGQLAGLLAPLRDCPIRVVLRDTISYVELARMLWHPSSLHQEPAARQKAIELLTANARHAPQAPDEPDVVAAEVDDLLVGDVPMFTTVAGHGELTGPGGTRTGEARDLVHASLQRWRALDLELDRRVTRAAITSAFLNDSGAGRQAGSEPELTKRLLPDGIATGDRERRRRALAARMVRDVAATAIRGDDDTAAWIAPVLGATGWGLQPLPPELYSGVCGIAVALAAYQREAGARRADPLPEAGSLLAATLRTLRIGEEQTAADRLAATATMRPEPVGGYVGAGSRITCWLLLARLGAISEAEGLARATAVAEELPAAVAADERYDVLGGMAGAVVPLLRLADLTDQPRWRHAASEIGDKLAALAHRNGPGAQWPALNAPDGLGGFAHGATGIGWALARLADATGLDRHAELAEAAFRFERSLYLPDLGGWRDLRKPYVAVAPWWCHGAGGVGIAAADLLHRHGADRWRETLGTAAALCWSQGMGTTHTLCHGDLGGWEVIVAARAAGVGPAVDRPTLDGHILSSLEQHGPHTTASGAITAPGLLHGLSGIAYQLLRMHPDSDLPTVLLPDPLG